MYKQSLEYVSKQRFWNLLSSLGLWGGGQGDIPEYTQVSWPSVSPVINVWLESSELPAQSRSTQFWPSSIQRMAICLLEDMGACLAQHRQKSCSVWEFWQGRVWGHWNTSFLLASRWLRRACLHTRKMSFQVDRDLNNSTAPSLSELAESSVYPLSLFYGCS